MKLPKLDLSIDEHDLTGEWVRQPQMVLTWTQLHADAIEQVDLKRAQLEVTKAEVSRLVREDPDEYGVQKVTESTIANAVTEHADVQELTVEVAEAKHTANTISGAVSAIEDRRRALQKLVDLYSTNYYTTGGEAIEKPLGVRRAKRRGRSDE